MLLRFRFLFFVQSALVLLRLADATLLQSVMVTQVTNDERAYSVLTVIVALKMCHAIDTSVGRVPTSIYMGV